MLAVCEPLFAVGSYQILVKTWNSTGVFPTPSFGPNRLSFPEGIDRQLDKAVELLLQEVGQGAVTKELIYATQRGMKKP